MRRVGVGGILAWGFTHSLPSSVVREIWGFRRPQFIRIGQLLLLLRARLIWNGGQCSCPVALLVGIMTLVAGDWRGYWLFYSEVAGILGVSILLDETVHRGSRQQRAQAIHTLVADPEAESHA